MIEEGKTYYIMNHAYHHFLVRIKVLLGSQRAECTDIVKIHSCGRGWTEFFKNGCQDDTRYMIFPDGELTWFSIFEWKHPIPNK